MEDHQKRVDGEGKKGVEVLSSDPHQNQEMVVARGQEGTSAKINFSYSILFHLTTSYSSYFGGKKGISRNKTSFFLLM